MGGKGRGKGRDTSGHHTQGPQRDKFDPGWQHVGEARLGNRRPCSPGSILSGWLLLGFRGKREAQPDEISSGS